MRVRCSSAVLAGLVAVAMTACATVPTGPSVMVMPGSGKSFEQFQTDDAVCRQWAGGQAGTTTSRAATSSTVTGGAIGTLLGAAAGAAIGAASGHAGTGAAVGAGVGVLGGTAVGAGNSVGAQTTVQQRYDNAYTQCMYAKGNQVPMKTPPAGYSQQYVRPPAAVSAPSAPPGPPPPPPPDEGR